MAPEPFGMTFKELLELLPSGLHDARLNEILVDYSKATARLLVDVSVGDPDAESEEAREATRRASVTFQGLHYFVAEAPRVEEAGRAGPLRIDAGLLSGLEEPPEVQLPTVAMGSSECWLFVRNWNAFIYVASETVGLEWL
jgi:hypothetical protein